MSAPDEIRTVGGVRDRIAAIREAADGGDHENAHMLERSLYVDVLRGIAAGTVPDGPRALAVAALEAENAVSAHLDLEVAQRDRDLAACGDAPARLRVVSTHVPALIARVRELEAELAAARAFLAADNDTIAEGARLRGELRDGLRHALDGWARALQWLDDHRQDATIARLRALLGGG